MEMLHTASLIHDDLPAMDNADYRRGKLTNHKVYGEAIAILAGHALFAHAFEYIVVQNKIVPAHQILKVVSLLSGLIGAKGLVCGQYVDLKSERLENIDLQVLNYIHQHKTGALLEACVVSGALLAGAKNEILPKLSRYAQNIGLAFQIIDDVLDITATAEQLGKTAGKDKELKKLTYPKLLGIEKSQSKAQELINEAKAELEYFGDKAIPLINLTDLIIGRPY